MKRRLIAVALLTTLALLGAALAFMRDGDPESQLTLYGNVDIREVELAFRVPGRLEEMMFEEGDAVAKSALVAQLDAEPYEEAVAAAEARVMAARAALKKLRSGPRPQEIAQARAQVREAEAAHRHAEHEFERQKNLRASSATSQQALDAARARWAETAARLAATREALALAEEGFRREDIAAGEAQLAVAEAELAQALTQLEDTRLVAPNDGVVLARIREPGSILAAGTPVYTLSLQHPVYVRAYVNEPDLGRIRPGMTVTVTTDSSEARYEGQIGFISPRAEFTPRAVETPELRTDLVYRLRIVVTGRTEGLRQGMPVTVTVPFQHADS